MVKVKETYGVGTNDIPSECGSVAHGKWFKMLQRCYSPKQQELQPMYIGCSVCDDWLTYSKFKEWFAKQPHTVGVQIDKDIIVIGNKLYSPETCCLVTQRLNLLMTTKPKGKLLVGVRKDWFKFHGQIRVDGKHVHLGSFATEVEAHEAYKKAKVVQIKRWLPYVTYDMRIVEGLNAHIERLENGHD